VCIVAQLFPHGLGKIDRKKVTFALPLLAPGPRQTIGTLSLLAVRVAPGQTARITIPLQTGAFVPHARANAELSRPGSRRINATLFILAKMP
jgi:hypothetical protein